MFSFRIFLDQHRRLRNGWWILIFFLLLAATLVPAQILANRNGTTLSIAMQAAMVATASLICLVLRRERLSSLLGPLSGWPRLFVLGCIMGAALMLLPALMLYSTGDVTWRANPAGLSTLLPSLGLYIAVAIAEELVFRGFVFQRLLAGIGAWPAQLLMAAYFVLTHWDNPGMTGAVKILASINIFLASIMLGLAYLRTRSLAMPIGLHLTLNFTQGGVLGFGVSGTQEAGWLAPVISSGPPWWAGGLFGLEASLPGFLFVMVGTLVLYRWRPAPSASKAIGDGTYGV